MCPLFAGVSGDDLTYLTSLGSGTWSGFSRCAFLIRTKPGVRGLLLCHADLPPAPDSPDSQPVVTLTKLSDELKSGLISFAVVRKLAQPLSAAERQGVRDFANRSVGKRMNARANIFMADPNDSKLQRLNCFRAVFGPHVERFFCSEFVAQMLVVAGRVHRKSSTVALDFLPNNSDGHVLRAPIALQCSTGSRFSTAFARPPRSPDRMQVFTALWHGDL
ncbi:g10449 [Coccomyxa elongata]